MIVGTGVDLAEVHRIQESIERFGDRFVQRIYTEREESIRHRMAGRNSVEGLRCGESAVRTADAAATRPRRAHRAGDGRDGHSSVLDAHPGECACVRDLREMSLVELVGSRGGPQLRFFQALR